MNNLNSVQAHPSESSKSTASPGGFRAHLQGVNLHDLVMLQRLVRASGVFVVISGERSGSLHFSSGELLHAETVDGSGDAAALQILSWGEGEFINSERAISAQCSVVSSLDGLFIALAKESDAAKYAEAQPGTATGIHRRHERSDFTASAAGITSSSGGLARSSALMAGGAGFPGSGDVDRSGTTSVGAATQAQDIAAAATPGTAAVAPRAPTRVADAHGIANVLVSPQGELVDGHGTDPEGLAARVAYLARLTELIGQAMGSGETRSLKVRAPNVELCIRRYPDGSVSGTLGIPEANPDSSSASSFSATLSGAAPPSTRLSRQS